MSGNNIARFPGVGELPDLPVTIDRGKDGFCRHPAIRLNEHDRAVFCAQCGASLDPFDYLRSEANAIRSGWDAHRMVKAKTDQLVERINLLEKEAKRLSALVRRLKAKEPPPVDFRKPL